MTTRWKLEDKPVVCRSKVDPAVLSSDQVEREMRRLLATGESPLSSWTTSGYRATAPKWC